MNRPYYPRTPPLLRQPEFSLNIGMRPPYSGWRVRPEETHLFIESIRVAILKYCAQSPARWNIPIEVDQVFSQNIRLITKPHPKFTLWVGFYNCGSPPVFGACRPKSRRQGKHLELTDEIVVYTKKLGKFVPLERLLEKEFPTIDYVPVGYQVMFEWWQVNGKVFNWPGLPNELKERILYFCMQPSPIKLPFEAKKGKYIKIKGAPEIGLQFGQWRALLGVSHQVRALCLRMCFVGSKDSSYGSGLCLDIKGNRALNDCMHRLAKFFQMYEPGCLPTGNTWKLAKTYDNFPRIYPHLGRYATMRHAIRKLSLELSFLNAMHFFRVTTGSFAQYFRPHGLDYRIFEQLPCLNELRIQLPNARGRLSDTPYQDGPRLFYGDLFNCPRVLHRLIYEQAAEVLATYDDVKMYGFVDEIEVARFFKLREDARSRLRFTANDLDELYKDDGGGIELENIEIAGLQKKPKNELAPPFVYDHFWPPKCRCEVRCMKVLYPDRT